MQDVLINNNNRKSNSNVCTIDNLRFSTIIQRINQNIHIKIYFGLVAVFSSKQKLYKDV